MLIVIKRLVEDGWRPARKCGLERAHNLPGYGYSVAVLYIKEIEGGNSSIWLFLSHDFLALTHQPGFAHSTFFVYLLQLIVAIEYPASMGSGKPARKGLNFFFSSDKIKFYHDIYPFQLSLRIVSHQGKYTLYILSKNFFEPVILQQFVIELVRNFARLCCS